MFLASQSVETIYRDANTTAVAVEAFCPTGEGGGIDNSCSPNGNGISTGVGSDKQTASYHSTQKEKAPSQSRRSTSHQTGPIDVVSKEPEEVEKWKARLGIAGADDSPLHRLGGAIHGSTVVVMPGRGGLHFEVNDDRYRAVSALTRNHSGELVVENFHFHVYKHERERGLGTEIVRTQIDAAKAIGAQKLVVHSIGDWKRRETHNGYYTWPRMGFDGDLPNNWQRSQPTV